MNAQRCAEIIAESFSLRSWNLQLSSQVAEYGELIAQQKLIFHGSHTSPMKATVSA